MVRHVAVAGAPRRAAPGRADAGRTDPATRRRPRRGHHGSCRDACRRGRRDPAPGGATALPDRRAGRGPPGPRHRVPHLHGAGRELRSRLGAEGGRRGRRGGQAEGKRRRLRADGQHPAHAVVGAGVREPRRRPVSHRQPGRCLDQGGTGSGGDRERQALRGQQPGGPSLRRDDRGRSLHGRRQDRRAHAAGDLPAAVRGGRQAGRGRVGDVLLQPPQRAACVREPDAARPHSQAGLGLSGVRARRLRRVQADRHRPCGRARLRALAVHGLDGGENYTPAAVQAALAAGRGNQAQVDRAVRRLLRTLFAFGFFDRAAYVDDGPASTEPAICASRASSRRPGSRCSRTTARCRSTRAGCARWR
jgi:hypothetical protein